MRPRLLVAVTLFVIVVVPVFASPAQACSCAQPPDIEAWLDESEAAFVGTLVDKRDVSDFESIYVFEVEEWVKGDVGEVIEVRSASDGAGCGFEFWDPDQRIGTIIYEEGGELHGGLCDQIDPDVLLAVVRGPTPSSTGVGHLLAAHGWSSPRLTVLDDAGGQVAEFIPTSDEIETGTQHLDVCPERRRMLQLVGSEISVWDLETFELVASHDVAGLDGFVADISCRDSDANSIWLLSGTDTEVSVLEVGPGPIPMVELEGHTSGVIGSDYFIALTAEGAGAVWVDIPSGDHQVLSADDPGRLRSLSAATHPTERRIALLETTFNEGGPVTAILSIVDGTGTRFEQFDIPWEAYSPTWLDADRVAVKTYDFDNWEESIGFVFDLETGQTTEIPGWDAEHTIAEGNVLYGVRGSSIITTDLNTTEIETMFTVPAQSAGPLVLLEESPRAATTTTATAPAPGEPGPTTPPLVAPGPEEGTGVTTEGSRWIGGGAIVVFIGILVWLAFRPPQKRDVT